MGLSAVSKPEHQASEALLSRVEARAEAWRRLAAALSEGDPAGRGRALSEELRGLAREATALGLQLLSEELSACRAVVQGALVLGRLDEQPRRELDDTLGRLARYASEQRLLATPRGRRRVNSGSLRIGLVASQRVVDGLAAEDWSADDEAPVLKLERLTPQGVLAGGGYELLVVDVDLEGGADLVERWLEGDETVPVVVLGSFSKVEDAAPFVARGAARTLAKPASPGELRRVCLEMGPAEARPFEPIGETTIERLGLRLSGELQRGLSDAAAHGRGQSIDLQGGAEVLTVLWEAVARIRELVTSQSKGVVRFASSGPIEALPRGGWLDTSRRGRGERTVALNEVRQGSVDLTGYRIIVAEDDLSVNWFIAGVLKTAGAEVVSARNGREAFLAALRHQPDLVITDAVMPELDGLSLRRALAVDVRLRSVPVIMLSWKEDLLQRVRELGVEAEGYLRKQATDREILQRIGEVLRPHRRLAERVSGDGPVRGRLDGLTACDLLSLVCRQRPNSRVTLRDTRHTYELEVRRGQPVLATRTDNEGSSTRGAAVIASLLGVGAGRFSVDPIDPATPWTAELDGSLEEQLLEPIARIRAAERLLRGPSLRRTERVLLNEEVSNHLLPATPEPAHSLLRTLLAGISPSQLGVSGRFSLEMLDRVLSDIARQGAVEGVSQGGQDVLAAAIERERGLLAGDPGAAQSCLDLVAEGLVGEPLEDPSPVAPVELALSAEDEPAASWPEAAGNDTAWVGREVTPSDVSARPLVAARAELPRAEPPHAELPRAEPPHAEPPHAEPPRAAPPHAEPPRAHTPVFASAVEDAEAIRHHTPVWSEAAERARLAELTPSSENGEAEERPGVESSSGAARAVRGERGRRRGRHDGSEERSRSRGGDAEGRRVGDEDDERDERRRARDEDDARDERRRRDIEEVVARMPRLPGPSAWATRAPESAPKRSNLIWPVIFGLVGIALAVGARWMREQQPPPSPPALAPPAQLPGAQPQSPGALGEGTPQEEQATPGPRPENATPPAANPAPKKFPLTEQEAARVADGEGMLEVVVGQRDQVFVGGKKVGSGPVVTVPLAAKQEPYEIRVKMRGEERVRYAVVEEDKRIRVRVAPPWSR